jgi:hypothetical protein|tara:strand:+ start:357 stop:863 length:507 start_codon:yes stop_codon:yes gene_type:complete
MKINKLEKKIQELNSTIDFIELNILDEDLRFRYIKVLRFQKALVRDIDRKGRKVPDNTPYVCEISGCEVNSIREKEPAYKLKENISLKHHLNNLGEHNSYSHILNNYSVKSMKKLLGRKINYNDLLEDGCNVSFIMQVFRHQEYYKKYVNINSLEKRIDNIKVLVDTL